MEYKIVNGTAFNINTLDMVAKIISDLVHSPERIRVYYGDCVTGECWMECYDTIGKVGRSCGFYKIPLLLKNCCSISGTAILTNCIVRIDSVSNHKTLYQHPKFHFKPLELRGNVVMMNNDIYARCKDEVQAKRLYLFILGKRHTMGGRVK